MPNSTFSTASNGKLVDYYDALGVSKTATTKEIQSAYRKLALKYHPDKNPKNPAAAERFKQLTRYRDVLEDNEQRRKYDYALKHGHDFRPEEQSGSQYGDSSRSESGHSSSSRSRSNASSFGGSSYSSRDSSSSRPRTNASYAHSAYSDRDSSTSGSRSNASYASSAYSQDSYASTGSYYYEPSEYSRSSDMPQKSRPRPRDRSPPRRDSYRYDDYQPQSRSPLRHAPSYESKSDSRDGLFGGYKKPPRSQTRDTSDRAEWLYCDILKRCKRICQTVEKARDLLEGLELIGADELRTLKRERSDYIDRQNAGMFCIMVDVLFEILETSAKAYKTGLRILDDAVEKRDAMPSLLKVDARLRGLEGSWLVTEKMLDMINNGIENEGWPVNTITATLEKVVKTWDHDLELPDALQEIIKVVRKAKLFEYEMNRSDKVIKIDR